ncbi:MAG: ABC transporter ATP-binding protein [Pseudomonadota bacterium]
MPTMNASGSGGTGPALELKGLTRRFGARIAVSDLNLRVEQGDLYGFLGPNGAGKTTTMRCVLGLIRRDAGEVAIFGDTDPVRQRRFVGSLVESPRFHEWMSGRANLRLACAYAGQGDEADIAQALDRVGLAGRGDDRVRTYSHGMRQRLGIARALVGHPKLLMLDEPTNGLDPRGMREVRDLLRILVERDGLTVFLSSHLLAEIEALCNRVGILDQGRLSAEGEVSTLVRGLAGDEQLEVGFEDADRARDAIVAIEGAEVIGSGDAGRLRVLVRGMTAADLNRRLVEAGQPPNAIVPQGRRLEDLYLARTRDEVR